MVTWAVGHLVNIAEPGEQNPAWSGRWAMGQLPMLPGRFTLGILPSTARQFETIRRFLLDEDITEVINATDAGREGELIFRRIYLLAGSTKPIRRLWASDMTEKGLKKAFDGLVDGEQKRNLGHAAFARAEADWLVGMNFSRLFTLRAGSLITVGRVQTPVLKLLVDRRREIENFVPRDYWTVEGEFTREDLNFKATWFAPPEFKDSKVWSEAEGREVVEACTGKDGEVLALEKKKGRQKAPLALRPDHPAEGSQLAAEPLGPADPVHRPEPLREAQAHHLPAYRLQVPDQGAFRRMSGEPAGHLSALSGDREQSRGQHQGRQKEVRLRERRQGLGPPRHHPHDREGRAGQASAPTSGPSMR